jgi:hypothetical protein
MSDEYVAMTLRFPRHVYEALRRQSYLENVPMSKIVIGAVLLELPDVPDPERPVVVKR